MLNMTAFPLFTGLQPYVARQIYETDQTGLAYMIAGAGFGSLVGSIVLSRYGAAFRPMRLGLAGCTAWYFFLLVFANVPQHFAGVLILFLAGLGQSASQVPMSAVLLRTAGERFRGTYRKIWCRLGNAAKENPADRRFGSSALFENTDLRRLSRPPLCELSFAFEGDLLCTVDRRIMPVLR